LGNLEGVSLPRDFERRVRFFYHENFYWGIGETSKIRFWEWASLSIGALLGN